MSGATPEDPAAVDAGATPAALRIVRGEPSAEELAAVVAVLSAAGSGAPSARSARSPWGGARRAARPVLSPGPDSWRMSAYPR